MAKSCSIIPKVTDKNGNKVDSRLFKDLLSYTNNNRVEATKLYLITKNDKFIHDWGPKLTFDDNNEPSLYSIINKTDLLEESKFLDKLNRDIGFYKKGTNRPAYYINNDKNYQDLLKRVISFNQNSEFRDKYVARIIRMADSESHRMFLGVKVEKRNRMNSIDADKMEYNYNLNNRLRDILASNGVSIGSLTELERRLGINGVADFNVAKTAASGLVEMIRLAEGIRGERALPEEFAHWVIEAMGDNPLINRLLNYINNNNLTTEVLGDSYNSYNELYNGDNYKLVKEAAGKLLAKHLLDNEPIVNKPYKNLLERVIEAVKNFLRTLNIGQIEKAMNEANKNFDKLAKDILEGRMDDIININNITSSNLFYQTNERVDRDKKLLRKIIDNELKRYKIYRKRNPNSSFDFSQRVFIDELEESLQNNLEIEGIYSFIENANSELEKVSKRLKFLESPELSIKEKAETLRNIKNYLYSYKGTLEDIKGALLEEEKYEDNRYGERVKIVLDNTLLLLGDLYIEYNKVSIPLFIDFIKPFVGDGIVVPEGKFKGKVLKAEDFIKTAEKDISFFDMWLDSMADSSESSLNIIDMIVKRSKENARLRTIELMKKIQAAALKLEKAGIKNTEWMYERDNKGNITGNYISEINQALFKENMSKLYKSLNEKYGRNPVGEAAEKYNNEKRAWFDSNMEIIDGVKRPKMSIYENPKFKALNNAQKEYYNEFMRIKEELDSYLPTNYTSLLNTIKIRKDLLERVKASDSIKSGVTQIWESIKDIFIRRADDTEFRDRATIKDFEGNEVQNLPIYYTKLREGEHLNDISTDATSTLIAYASMAMDFNEMSKIIDILEIGRDIIRDRDVTVTQGERQLKERINLFGVKIENPLTKQGRESRISKRLDYFFDMQVYGRYMEDEGTFGNTKIDKGKAANFLNMITSLTTMAGNILASLSNVFTGDIMMKIEASAREFFNFSNMFKADRIYGSNLPEFLAEIGNRVKTSKLALWCELFNVVQEYEKDIREINFDRKTWFSRMFGMSTLFFMSNAGEHWMQTRTSLALADAYKMKAPNGKIVNLWDAMEVVPIDKNNKRLGARLQVKSGYTKEDGSEFTKEDIIAFSRKSAAINQRMHGIYNKADRNAMQKMALGRMAIMYRKWLKPSLNRRFKSLNYNRDLDAWTEGYYLTTGRFLLQLANDIRKTQFDIVSEWNNLSKREKANIRRAITEVAHFAAISLILGLIDWDDDDDSPWIKRMAEYQLRRLKTEIGILVPGKPMLDEGLKIIKSPAAGIQTLQSTLDLIGLINPMNYETFAGEDAIIQSGQYKGRTKAHRLLMRSPLIPMRNTIIRGVNPELVVPYFKQ